MFCTKWNVSVTPRWRVGCELKLTGRCQRRHDYLVDRKAGDMTTCRYRSAFDECIGDHALTERKRLELFPGCRQPGSHPIDQPLLLRVLLAKFPRTRQDDFPVSQVNSRTCLANLDTISASRTTPARPLTDFEVRSAAACNDSGSLSWSAQR